MSEPTQEQMLEVFFGKPKPRQVWFSDGAKFDAKSAEGGVYDEHHPLKGRYKRPYFVGVLMFNARDPDGKDVTCREATQQDIRQYPNEHKYYQERRHLISIDKLPKITPAALEALRYIGIFTVQDFAAIEEQAVFEELKDLHRLAKTYLDFLAGNKPRVKLEVAA